MVVTDKVVVAIELDVEDVEAVNGPVKEDDSVVDTDDDDDDGEDLADRTGSVFVPYILSTQSCRVARPKERPIGERETGGVWENAGVHPDNGCRRDNRENPSLEFYP